MKRFKHLFKKQFIIYLTFILFGCAYFNTLFNAKESYREGSKKIEASRDGKITPDIRNNFYKTIDKCWNLINLYGDSSEYADDALLLIGKSHYNVEEYVKSERFLNQFILRYVKSELLPEAKLWRARALIKLDKNNEALIQIDEIFQSKVENEIAALALYSKGHLHYLQENYDDALENFRRCIEVTDDEVLAADAQFEIGNIFFIKGDYVNAIGNFTKVRDFEPTLKTDFEANFKKVDAQIKLGQFEPALKVLNSLQRQNQFQDKFSEIEAKIGDIYLHQNKFDNAASQYDYVMEKYPRTEGSANAAYGLARLMEFNFTNIDSAKVLYSKVKREYNKSLVAEEAESRSALLQTYLKFKENIKTDISELLKIEEEDSLIRYSITDSAIVDSQVVDTIETANEKEKGVPQNKKQLRSREQLIKSLDKNKFALAEFFMLNMQNYDSAEIAYTDFINSSEDSLLKPKAYHALDYLYSFIKVDSLRADSIEQIILKNFPESEYATYILQKRVNKIEQEEKLIPEIQSMYHKAEELLENNNFNDALKQFEKIAEIDSGGSWGEKSSYAIAWIYEKKLNKTARAIDAYSFIVKAYPNSKIAIIAQNKIKEPPKEEIKESEDEENMTKDAEKTEEINPPDSDKQNKKSDEKG